MIHSVYGKAQASVPMCRVENLIKDELNERMSHIHIQIGYSPGQSLGGTLPNTHFLAVLTRNHVASFYADRRGEFLPLRSRLMICM